jgi:protein-disulfide isomerase
MKLHRHVLTLAALALVSQGLATTAFAAGEDEELSAQVDTLKQGQDEIRKELAEIKKLLQQGVRAAAPSGPNVAGKIFNLGENPAKGSSGAKVALIEFTDYQCPFCKRHTENTQPQIESEYVDSGKVRFISLDMPLPNLHKLAMKAAEAAHCADDQGQYWQMRDRMFENQRALEPWNSHAEALSMDVARYEECLNSGKYAGAVKADLVEASKAGATGTPSFVVAVIDEKDPSKAIGVTFIRGAQQFGAFKTALDDALASLN